MKILGIDESGRGPVCGPMVICGYMIDEEKLPQLKAVGAKDSKMLAPEKREALAPLLKKLADDFLLLSVTAADIDKLRTESNLNAMEIEKMQHIINALNPDKVVVDAPEVDTANFSKKIRAKLRNKKVIIVAENFADKNYLEVGAASILAKTERDMAVRKLHRLHGYFGSGYPSDETTIRFLKDWIKKNKEFPDFVRKSWFTAHRIKAEKEQTKMERFTGKK